MKRSALAIAILMTAGAPAFAASAVNLDKEPRTLVVTESGTQSQVVIPAGETIQFCSTGCFVTMPNGDREALTGAETFEISGGRAHFR